MTQLVLLRCPVGQLPNSVLGRPHPWSWTSGLFHASVVNLDSHLFDPVFLEFWPFVFLACGGALDAFTSQAFHFHR